MNEKRYDITTIRLSRIKIICREGDLAQLEVSLEGTLPLESADLLKQVEGQFVLIQGFVRETR